MGCGKWGRQKDTEGETLNKKHVYIFFFIPTYVTLFLIEKNVCLAKAFKSDSDILKNFIFGFDLR